MRSRLANLRHLRGLDPGRDYLKIYQTMLRYEFPWDMKLGLNLAFNRSFSEPAMAALGTATGELTERTQRRIDDTGLLMYEIVLHGFDHPRGRAAVRRINQIHRWHADAISNDAYLYVLGCLVVVPTRWLARYGWRRPCCHERTATHAYYRELGRRMGITEIPASYEAFEAWFDERDAALLRPNAGAAAIERATRTLLLGRMPRVLSPIGDALVSCLYDDRLRRAVQVPRPPWPVRAGLHAALKTRGLLLRYLARPRTEPLFAAGIATKSYPIGYDIAALGPAPPPAAERSSRR